MTEEMHFQTDYFDFDSEPEEVVFLPEEEAKRENKSLLSVHGLIKRENKEKIPVELWIWEDSPQREFQIHNIDPHINVRFPEKKGNPSLVIYYRKERLVFSKQENKVIFPIEQNWEYEEIKDRALAFIANEFVNRALVEVENEGEGTDKEIFKKLHDELGLTVRDLGATLVRIHLWTLRHYIARVLSSVTVENGAFDMMDGCFVLIP